MKLVTFKALNQKAQAGWIEGETVYSIAECSGGSLPATMAELIKISADKMPELQQLVGKQQTGFSIHEVELLAPLENPSSVRDFMAFENHLLNASKKSGLTIHPEWYKIPVFYFTNHQSIHGPNQTVDIPPNCKMFDYELEIAAVIGNRERISKPPMLMIISSATPSLMIGLPVTYNFRKCRLGSVPQKVRMLLLQSDRIL